MKYVAKTDVGKIRTNNEDTYYANIYDDEFAIYIVADGLGGYESGEVASQMLVEEVSKQFESKIEEIKISNNSKIKLILEKIILNTNELIYNIEKTNDKYKGMGTTVVVVFKIKSTLYYTSVGDSRIYHIDENIVVIEQITEDDTYVNELVKTKVIDKSEVDKHPQKHMLTKAIGVFKDLNVKVKILDRYTGYLMLCTDGITNTLKANEVINIFRKTKFEKLADKLVEKANDNGGTDNITVIVIKL